eukprot:TRINITY_DN28687_c0_g2_i1.p1 TRINITY_DN28687_c0_g2~~TRINITY_DN28687_c0_g2_i1.p1  ORF type:complete len:696 (+),score=144.16 TRINITY_DN28687_c0_g2_i1:83-2089(+)
MAKAGDGCCCLSAVWLALGRGAPVHRRTAAPDFSPPGAAGLNVFGKARAPSVARTCTTVATEGWASPAPDTPLTWCARTRSPEDLDRDSVGTRLPVRPRRVGSASSTAAASEEHWSIELHPSPGGGAMGPRRRLGEVGVRDRGGAEALPAPSAAAAGGFQLEQLLASPGTLPQISTQAEREEAMRDCVDRALAKMVAGASTCERLAKVQRRLLAQRGPQAQRLRRGLLRGSTIVFFTAGYEGKRFVYERAHELGVRSVLIESPDSWSRSLVDEGIVAKFIPLDMTQSSREVYRQALEAIQKLGDEDPSLAADGIATVVELSVPTAARLAEALGLPGPLPEAVDRARDKGATRGALAAAGLPTPPFRTIASAADLEEAAKAVGFPAVLKPVSGAASLGVKKVASAGDLRETYAELQRELGSLVVASGALVKDDGRGNGVSAGAALSTVFVLERYLDGAEVDVDLVMCEGEWQYAAVSDNGPTLEPYFNETWAVSPSLLPRQQQVELKELAISSVKALGFTDGIFHVECKYTSIGPHLIEVNARMGGGPVHMTNLRTWNVDLVEETLFLAVGIPSKPAVSKQPVECIANSDINAMRSGTLLDLGFLEPLRDREGVLSFSPHVVPGERVVGPQDGLPTWLVEVVVAKETAREALDFLLSLEAEVQALVRLA